MTPEMPIGEAVAELRKFVDRYRPSALRINEVYGINHRTLKDYLEGHPPKKIDPRRKLIRFACAIIQSPEDVVASLGLHEPQPPLRRSEPAALMRAAGLLADSDDGFAAVATAKLALTTAIRCTPADAPEHLPGTLFYTHRYGTPGSIEDLIRNVVIPAIDRRAVRISPLIAAAALGQVACALNETGDHDQASTYFEMPKVRALRMAGGHLAWCGPALLRNEAHYWAWYQGMIGRAADCAEMARDRSSSAANRHSVINTLCETHLAVQSFRHAWEAIEPTYLRVRQHLCANFDAGARVFRGEPLTRFHHSCESLLLGVTARAQVAGPIYFRGELGEDLLLLEALMDQGAPPSARITSMGIRAVPPLRKLPAALAERLENLRRRVIKKPLPPSTARAVTELAGRLTGAS